MTNFKLIFSSIMREVSVVLVCIGLFAFLTYSLTHRGSEARKAFLSEWEVVSKGVTHVATVDAFHTLVGLKFCDDEKHASLCKARVASVQVELLRFRNAKETLLLNLKDKEEREQLEPLFERLMPDQHIKEPEFLFVMLKPLRMINEWLENVAAETKVDH